MAPKQFRPVLVAAAALCVGLPTLAQLPAGSRPTPEQARAMLQANPQLIEQVRQRLMSSGLTRDQIHARLRAEGYPEDMLDAYLPGATGAPTAPTSDFYNAVRELGVADSTDITLFRSLQSNAGASASDSAQNAYARRGPVRSDVADAEARVDSGFNIFGLALFRSGATRIDASYLGPVDNNYRLGPGDGLVLILTGDVEAAQPMSVTREGFVLIPQVGQVYVNNLTLGQFTDVLYSRLGRVYSGVRRGPSATTLFTITVARLRTNQVFVLGEVERPGSYMVSSAGTALTSLYAAGGPTANGSMRQVQIRRGGRTVATVDLYDYLLRGDASRDARLETGDIVFVPARGIRVRVIGEVMRPATYELQPNETLGDLITAAGGYNPNALQRRVHIQRLVPAGQRRADGRDRETLDVTGDLASGAGRTFPLAGGDVVRVFEVADRVRNTITVEGNVWNPGPQGLVAGMTIAQAIVRAGGLKPDTYLGQILVSRLSGDSIRTQFRAALRDTAGTVIGDMPLLEDDVIQVFSVTEFRPDRYVAIGGAVQHGGRFPYRRGMTVRDLVLLAGGLNEGAYLKEAEIARLPADRSGALTASTVRFALDSTYLFDRKVGELYLGAPGLSAQSSGAPEIELQPYDNVLILQQPSWELQRVVTISGEVNFPGQYALKSRNERLADLVDRAGGFTAEAYPEGTVFTRLRDTVGRVALDVRQAMRERNSPENMLLVDGDAIAIPQRSLIVSVRGAVNAPNVVAYVPGKSLSYYISQAGGPARQADSRRAYVTQPTGKREVKNAHWYFWDGVPEPMPGSIVIVPERNSQDRGQYMALLSAIVPAVTALTTLYIALKQP